MHDTRRAGFVNITNNGTLILANAGNTSSEAPGFREVGRLSGGVDGELVISTGLSANLITGHWNSQGPIVSARNMFLDGAGLSMLGGDDLTLYWNVTGPGS